MLALSFICREELERMHSHEGVSRRGPTYDFNESTEVAGEVKHRGVGTSSSEESGMAATPLDALWLVATLTVSPVCLSADILSS